MNFMVNYYYAVTDNKGKLKGLVSIVNEAFSFEGADNELLMCPIKAKEYTRLAAKLHEGEDKN